jgi:hypothetical protein
VKAGSQLPDVIAALVAACLPAEGFDWSQAFDIDPGSLSSGRGGLKEVKAFIAEQFVAEIQNTGSRIVRPFFLDLPTDKGVSVIKASTTAAGYSPSPCQQAFEEFERALVRDVTLCTSPGCQLFEYVRIFDPPP